MLKNEDLKVINKLLKGEEVEEVLEHKVKEKVEYVVEMLDFQEKAQEEMAKIQDKIVALDKVNKNEEIEEKQEEVEILEDSEEIYGIVEG